MNLYNKKDEVNYQFDHGSDDQSQSMILSSTDWEIFVGPVEAFAIPQKAKMQACSQDSIVNWTGAWEGSN